MKRIYSLTLPFLLLTACEPADNEPGPGGVTVGEAKALDEAAEMLEQQRLPQEALEEPEAAAETEESTPAG